MREVELYSGPVFRAFICPRLAFVTSLKPLNSFKDFLVLHDAIVHLWMILGYHLVSFAHRFII